MSSIVKPSRPAALLCAGVLCLLAACATTGPGVSGERRAESLARSGQHSEAAAYYIDLATRAAGMERDRLTLLAIEQWLDAGDGGRARNALSTISMPPEGEMRWLWTSNAAAVALWEGKPADALELLEPLAQEPLSLRYRSRVEALRADAWFQKDEPVRAVELYLQRENWLHDPAWVELSRKRLWSGLLVSDPQTLRDAAERVRQPAIKGWLELGALAASTGQTGVGWRNGVARWQEDWPRHPANLVLEGLPLPDGDVSGFPRHIALLLPLSGQNAAAGSAIRNGFLGAYFAAATELEDEQEIRLYDVNGGGGAPEAYEQAVTDGAQFVVGPLLRPEVAALAAQSPLSVPVLTLNYLPDGTIAPPGFYQFALAPEDEAVSAADRALADGHRRAVALVPNNDWGRRMLSSFATAFEAGGGVLLEYRDYRPTMQDFSFEIEGLMALTESVQRYQRLRANIGGPLQFDPRRRQDVEFVFLGADAKAGRLIKSQLKFHYAGDLPVYSTSFIYSMDGRSNSDLNGVMFADTPWVVAPRPWMSHLPALYDEYWPNERRLARLHAMGYDAYQLVAELHAAGSEPMPELSGATGRLYLDAEGRIHRRLAWARFVGGRPVALETDRPGEPADLDEAELTGPWQRRPLNP
jgi:uncharacterized protein